MSHIKVTQKASLIGQAHPMHRVIFALGLGRINQSNTLPDNNCTRGMINKVKHLVRYELDAKAPTKPAKAKVAKTSKTVAAAKTTVTKTKKT